MHKIYIYNSKELQKKTNIYIKRVQFDSVNWHRTIDPETSLGGDAKESILWVSRKKKNDQVSSKGDLEKGLKLHVTVQLSNIMSQYLQSP